MVSPNPADDFKKKKVAAADTMAVAPVAAEVIVCATGANETAARVASCWRCEAAAQGGCSCGGGVMCKCLQTICTHWCLVGAGDVAVACCRHLLLPLAAGTGNACS